MNAGIAIQVDPHDLADWHAKRTWLAAQRARLGLGQRVVAQRMGVVQARVSELENGVWKRPGIELIERYLQALRELSVDLEPPPGEPDEPEAVAAPVQHRRGQRENMLHEQLKAKALQLLGDGQWHNYEQVLRELGRAVPPGLAIRKAETERLKGRRARGERKVALPIERQIENGRRAMARAALRTGRFATFETDMPGDPKRHLPQRRIRLVKP